ncbi:hypothetical protein BY458DRAFT_519981 [Sporodiniella umbellata]|nr:hypothetical protein BY458DRAFT_519981 [Sporodiniella umbellata]
MFLIKKRLIVGLGLGLCLVLTSVFYLAQPEAKAIPVIFPAAFEIHQPSHQERYLSYLPHSGFHNQRIELENALLLASYLNRTLLVPPVMLASPAMPWMKYERLYERLMFQSKHGLEHCATLHGPLPSECLNSFRYTNIPWSFFYNMTAVQENSTPLVFRDSHSYQWIYRTLNVKPHDVYFFKDQTPYEYQIHDDASDALPLDRFSYRMHLNTLKAIEHPVLHFGSLFGSYRVLAETEENMERLRAIRSSMIFRQPVLSQATDRIVQRLGGKDQFVGIHLRVGDGIFKLRASITVDDMFHALVDALTDLSLDEVRQYDPEHDQDRLESSEYEVTLRSMPTEQNHTKPISVHHPTDTFTAPLAHPGLPACQPADAINQRFRHTVLYIATDAPNPRHHPLLQKLFRLFPCTFVLSDFQQDWQEVKKLQVVQENVPLEGYLIPILDAMISAHGHTFLGTPHSTFTHYIERQLHPVYTQKQVQVMGLADYLQSQS